MRAVMDAVNKKLKLLTVWLDSENGPGDKHC
jgi:hypothetical protein